jgi:hypothetical protein
MLEHTSQRVYTDEFISIINTRLEFLKEYMELFITIINRLLIGNHQRHLEWLIRIINDLEYSQKDIQNDQ